MLVTILSGKENQKTTNDDITQLVATFSPRRNNFSSQNLMMSILSSQPNSIDVLYYTIIQVEPYQNPTC
jgi:hypothetical protein